MIKDITLKQRSHDFSDSSFLMCSQPKHKGERIPIYNLANCSSSLQIDTVTHTKKWTKMKRYLIITGDDFGFSQKRNKGIMETFNNGGITSASLLLNCTGTDEAADMYNSSDICPGLHLNLTEGSPVGEVNYETLVSARERNFRGKLELRKKLDLGDINLREVKQEIDSQIKKFIDLVGKPPVYVDGHQHIHLHPKVVEILAAALRQNNIQITRFPVEINMHSKEWVNPDYMSFFTEMIENALKAKKVVDDYGIKTTDTFVGLSTMGSAMTQERLQKIILEAFEDAEHRLSSLAEQRDFSTCELMTHPGYPSHRVLSGFSWGSDDFGCSDDRIHEIKILSSSEMREFYKRNNIEVVSHKILLT
ncbi:hypothetical protein Btru_001548 [Bulinus truncatus]|nr:hypothetical protein Btru_001548 [Bulinus truncatus]